MPTEQVTRALVTQALILLRANYVFPDQAEQAAVTLAAELDDGRFDGLDEQQLGRRLTERLYELCADRHLRVRPRDAASRPTSTPEEAHAAWVETSRLRNYGVAKVEHLAGNVGYLDLSMIANPGAGGTAMAAAMELVTHTYALLIDLRNCGGGSPHGVIFWCSYLFADSETHLNDIYDGATGQTRQFWSAAYVPGRRYLDRPVYVLTSGTTFSGAEELAYNLKNQGRATIVGETTRGGAHPTDAFPVSATMEITVPVARSVSPVTGTNWEGTGVEPDVAVSADTAFDVAYGRALRHVTTLVPSADGTDADALERAQAALADLQYFEPMH